MMSNVITVFFICFIFLTLQSCRLDNSKISDVKKKSIQENDTKKLSLYQMETINKTLIDSVEKRVLKQVKQRDFIDMFKEADTSLVKLIDVSDVKAYFKMIDSFYGQLDTLKIYGTTSTENGKSLDYIANFSTGDSLELNYKLLFYNHDVKLSYITMNRFSKDPIPEAILKLFEPKIENIFKKNHELVYNDCSEILQSKITKEKIKELLNKNFNSKDSNFNFIDCKPLIFGKGQVGFLFITQKAMDNGKTKNIKIAFFLNKDGAYKIGDIKINE